MASVFLIVCGIALALRYLWIWSEMARLPAWLRREAQQNRDSADAALAAGAPLPRLIFVIPALEEFFTIGQTLDGLMRATPPELRDRVSLLVVTTEKEVARRREMLEQVDGFCAAFFRLPLDPTGHFFGKAEAGLRQVISRFAKRWKDNPPELRRRLTRLLTRWPYTWDLRSRYRDSEVPIFWLHAPEVDGNMASQLNGALRHLAVYLPDPSSTYFVVYNADTVPDGASVSRLMELLLREGKPEAAQLMCVSMKNFNLLSDSWRDAYLAGAAIYQSRWALGYEFRMLRRRSDRWWPSLQSLFHYCRGHGMTFRCDYLLQVGGFETSTALEDLFQGYMLSCQRKDCLPVPVLEWTESPTSVRELVRQKRFWFSGMLDVLRFPHLRSERGVRLQISPLTHLAVLAVGLYREVFTWLCGPLLVAGFVAASLVSGNPAWCLLPVANACVSVALVWRATPRSLRPAGGAALLRKGLITAAGVLLYSVSRNLGPLLACADLVRNRGKEVAYVHRGSLVPQDRK